MGVDSWSITSRLATASELHSLVLPTGEAVLDEASAPRREIRIYDVSDRTLVVGSAQVRDAARERDVRDLCEAQGVAFVRRQSGGGAVWLAPQQQIWIDVVVPTDDTLWQRDVGQAFVWLGEAWVAGLEACGVEGVSVYQGAYVADAASKEICFATQGAGEVFVDGRKLVGLSQKRTRHATLFQTSAHVNFAAQPFVDLLTVDSDVAKEVTARVTDLAQLRVDPTTLRDAVVAAISAH